MKPNAFSRVFIRKNAGFSLDGITARRLLIAIPLFFLGRTSKGGSGRWSCLLPPDAIELYYLVLSLDWELAMISLAAMSGRGLVGRRQEEEADGRAHGD